MGSRLVLGKWSGQSILAVLGLNGAGRVFVNLLDVRLSRCWSRDPGLSCGVQNTDYESASLGENLAKSIMLQMHVAVMLHNPKATQAR
jgi:hypothetical protein